MDQIQIAPKFCYGQRVVDKLTKFRGKVTGFAYYYGKRNCSYLVEAIDSTGRPIEYWTEEERLAED